MCLWRGTSVLPTLSYLRYFVQGRNKGKGHNKRYAGKRDGGGGSGAGAGAGAGAAAVPAAAPELDAEGKVIPGAGYKSLCAMDSPLFVEYYKKQGLIGEEEWPAMMAALHKVLPVTFRINGKDPMGPAYVQQSCQSAYINQYRRGMRMGAVGT